jgi:hypothetical protein
MGAVDRVKQRRSIATIALLTRFEFFFDTLRQLLESVVRHLKEDRQ